MANDHKTNNRVDEATGTEFVGHEWDGIQELDTPMPRAFHIWLWLSILVCVLLWLLYPSFPYVTNYAKGVLGYSSRVSVTQDVTEGRAHRADTLSAFVDQDYATLMQDTDLRDRFEPQIAVLFRDNCAACHGRSAVGQTGFPDLTDDHWLWSGEPEEIEYTLQVGINADHPDTRFAQMPAFGRDGLLEKPEIADVIEYVLGLSGQNHDECG